MRKIGLAFLPLLLSVSILSSCSEQKLFTKSFFAMDTFCSVSVYSLQNDQENLLENSETLCREFENILSKKIISSDVYKINQSKGNPVEVSDETIKLLNLSNKYMKLTNGAFDITIGALSDLWDFKNINVPPSDDKILNALKTISSYNIIIEGNTVKTINGSSLDLGAIAKGYIADKTAMYLRDEGVESAILDFGGSITLIGQKPTGDFWNVGIRKPFKDDKSALATLSVKSDKSIVTSGVYQRYFEYNNKIYHHIISPQTGSPTENDLLSVTIIGDYAADCDALATGCMVMGLEKGLELIESLEQFEAVFVTTENKIIISSGIGENKDIRLKIGRD